MYLADYHTHTRFSPDGSATMTEMAQAALDGMGDNSACILGNHGLLCVGGNISYTAPAL